jgi:chromosome segregation ATPase
MECPIMFDSRLGFSVIPLPFIEIAERMGYQSLMVGNRKTISVASLLPQMPGKAGSRSGSTSSSQSSLALSSVSDMSTTVIDSGTQEALSIVRQQGQEILGQVSSLKDVVTELSSGQQALYSRQSELQGQLATQAATSLKLLKAMSNIKEDFKTFKVEQEKSFAAEQAKYKVTMDRLNELLAIEDSDVKGPLDGMESG